MNIKVTIIFLTCIFVCTGVFIYLWGDHQRTLKEDDLYYQFLITKENKNIEDLNINTLKDNEETLLPPEEQKKINNNIKIYNQSLNNENDPDLETFYKNIYSRSYGWVPYPQPLNETNHINILILGIDASRSGTFGRSDTIMIASFSPEGEIGLLSIPRDTLVNISGYGYGKINSAYTFGGVKKSIKTVQEILGIPIHHYITVDFWSTAKLIDIIGGVTIDVEKNLKYQDKTAKLYIDIKKGKQTLNGKQAACYMRFRHDPYSDIGRIHRQQKFIKATLNKLKEPSMIFQTPKLIELGFKYIKTDMNLLTLYDLGSKVLKVLENESSLNFSSVPGYSVTTNASYWVMDQAKTLKIAGKLLLGKEIEIILPSDVPKPQKIYNNNKNKYLNTKKIGLKTENKNIPQNKKTNNEISEEKINLKDEKLDIKLEDKKQKVDKLNPEPSEEIKEFLPEENY